jgi:hypothetical protein
MSIPLLVYRVSEESISVHIVEFGKFRDTVMHSWYTRDDTGTGKYPITKWVLIYSQCGGPMMIILTRDTNCTYSLKRKACACVSQERTQG